MRVDMRVREIVLLFLYSIRISAWGWFGAVVMYSQYLYFGSRHAYVGFLVFSGFSFLVFLLFFIGGLLRL